MGGCTVTTVTKAIDFLRPVSFRGKPRVISPLIPRSGIVTARVFGAEMQLDLSNYIDRMIYLGCYEPLNTYRFRSLLSPGMTVVDVGANIGYFSLLAASIVGQGGKVVAVEPHPETYRSLKRTIDRNNSRNVRAHRIALSDVEETLSIHMADQEAFPNRTATTVRSDDPEYANSPTVQSHRLDRCISDWRLEVVDLLKVDVDGFETKVMRGARSALESGLIRNVIIEFSDYWLGATGSSTEKLKALITDFGLEERRNPIAAFFLGPSPDRLFSL